MVTTPSSVWSAGGTGVPTPGILGSMPGQKSGVMCRLANCNLLQSDLKTGLDPGQHIRDREEHLRIMSQDRITFLHQIHFMTDTN